MLRRIAAHRKPLAYGRFLSETRGKRVHLSQHGQRSTKTQGKDFLKPIVASWQLPRLTHAHRKNTGQGVSFPVVDGSD